MFRKDVRDAGAAADAVAAQVREWSKSGRLTSEPELRPFADTDGALQSTIAEALQQHDDLHELASGNGARYYYSSEEMTEGYASMLLQKLSDPVRLLAEVIRENSASYPRPVPLDMFTRPPFDLTREQVLECLDRMAREEEYRDIASATTSAATIFLYSTLHLEHDHASMLAEWFDVGQGENP